MDKYTTAELISKIDPKETAKLAEEQSKIIISNDTFALIETLQALRGAFLRK